MNYLLNWKPGYMHAHFVVQIMLITYIDSGNKHFYRMKMTIKVQHCNSPELQPAHSCGPAASVQADRAPPLGSGVEPAECS